MDASEHDVLAYMSFPRQHRTKLHSTNPIERLNKEVKRRADVVGIFPNEASIMRLIGAVLFEQNDEWQTSSRYMMVEAFAQIDKEEIDPILSITTKSRLIMTSGHPENYTSLTDATHRLDGWGRARPVRSGYLGHLDFSRFTATRRLTAGLPHAAREARRSAGWLVSTSSMTASVASGSLVDIRRHV